MCSSNDEKQLWLTALKKIIRDFQLKEVAERKGTELAPRAHYLCVLTGRP